MKNIKDIKDIKNIKDIKKYQNKHLSKNNKKTLKLWAAPEIREVLSESPGPALIH